jgi:hypothetical protein
MALFHAEMWAPQKIDQNNLESFENEQKKDREDQLERSCEK